MQSVRSRITSLFNIKKTNKIDPIFYDKMDKIKDIPLDNKITFNKIIRSLGTAEQAINESNA